MENLLEKLNIWLAVQLNKLAFASPVLFLFAQSLIGIFAGGFALGKFNVNTPEWLLPILNAVEIPSLNWLIVFVLGGVGLLLKSHTSTLVKESKKK